jgi:LacI family transcriptional regulator
MVYGRSVLRGISRYLVENEPWSLYLDMRELVAEPPSWLGMWDGDGVISRSTTPELAGLLKRKNIPTVDLTDIYGDLGLPHIWTNHERVGEMAADHLFERGFKHFGYCGFSDHNWSTRRYKGFASRMHNKGFTVSAYQSPWGEVPGNTWDHRQNEIANWLIALPKPVGIMCCNDMRGQHVLDACRRAELSVPEEVTVIGVDNDEILCGLCDPPLSSVVLNTERIGYEAAYLLDQLMKGHQPSVTEIVIDPLGIETRQSSDVLAIEDNAIAAAVKFIRERACDGITVNEVLDHVPLTRGVLERKFRKYLGRSPQSEIRQVQMKRVKTLLVETDLPLEKIAAMTGFEHPEYMNVVFKRLTGQSPGRYRRQTKP